jgi:hypothetical protein
MNMEAELMSTDECGHSHDDKSEEPIPDEEIEELRRDFCKLQQEFKELDDVNKPHLDAWLRGLVGSHLDVLLQDQQETLRCLTHINPDFRRVALHLACDHWDLTDQIAAQSEKMALTDPNDGVRETAIGTLGSCYSGTKDLRVGKLLATIAYDERQTEAIRVRAFTALIRLHGILEYTGSRLFSIHSLPDIDWKFVDQYRN